jgi:hypothetical protein
MHPWRQGFEGGVIRSSDPGFSGIFGSDNQVDSVQNTTFIGLPLNFNVQMNSRI